MNAGRSLASGRTARLVEILASRQEEEEILLERGTPRARAEFSRNVR